MVSRADLKRGDFITERFKVFNNADVLRILQHKTTKEGEAVGAALDQKGHRLDKMQGEGSGFSFPAEQVSQHGQYQNGDRTVYDVANGHRRFQR